MDDGISTAAEVLSLAGVSSEVRNVIDWEFVDHIFELGIPGDLRWLLERLPRCVVQGVVVLAPPVQHGVIDFDYFATFEDSSWDAYIKRHDDLKNVPYALYPEWNCLVPWALTNRGGTFYLKQVDEEDPDTWTVVFNNGDYQWDTFDGSVSQFLVALMRHEFTSAVLEPVPDPGPPVIEFVEE